jgi:hypothetical protein
MSNPNKSPEIVTEQELVSTLPKLDVDTFLRMYNEWKVTNDPSTFAALRSMHENAGYNNKNIVFGAENEMHQIAAIVQNYKDGKIAVVRWTVNAINTAPRSYIVTVTRILRVYNEQGKPVENDIIAPWLSITLTTPSVDKIIEIGGGKFVMTEILIDGKRKVWVQKSDIAAYTPPGIPAPQPSTPEQGLAPQQRQRQGVEEIREVLQELTPEKLEEAVTLMEAYISKLTDAQSRNTLRGIHGAIIIDTLRNAGHNIIMRGNEIIIVPKPGSQTVFLQEKLQTLIATGKLPVETLKLGILYSAPAFKKYAELKKTKDAQGRDMIDPKATSEDFLKYLKDLQNTDAKSPNIASILESQTMLRGMDMQAAIRGFQDLGQVGEWMNNNSAALAQSQAILQSAWRPAAQGAPTAPGAPAEKNTTYTGALINGGVTWGKVTGVVGDGFKWLMSGIGDIMSLGKWDPIATVWIGAALAYGVYKTFQKFGFLWGIGTLFGLGALNNLEKIMGRFGVDMSWFTGKVKTAAEEAAEKARKLAEEAAAGVGITNPPAKPTGQAAQAATETFNTSNLSDFNRAWIESIKGNTSLKEDIENHSRTHSIQKATLNEYLMVIHKDSIQNITLDKLIYTPDHKQSIFSENPATLFWNNPDITDSMSRMLLKRVIRSYIGSNESLSGSTATDPEGKTNLDAFKNKYPENTWKTRTLKDLIAEIYKK